MTQISDIIRDRLAALEAEHGFRILFACESGSRAWDFASADSDYDVRFVFSWPVETYLSVFDPQATFDFPLDENGIDLSGWDLRKALGLFRKSNGSVCEWLASPIVYTERQGAMGHWRNLAAKAFVPKFSAAHYLGLCRRMRADIESGETTSAKRYLYAIRALLAARFVTEFRDYVPVRFQDLRSRLKLETGLSRRLDTMIAEKERGREADSLARDPILDRFLSTEMDRVESTIDDLPEEPIDDESLNAVFRSILHTP